MLMWGGSVSVLSTHNGDSNAFNLLVNEIIEGKKNYTLHTTNIEDAITDGLYKRICEVSKEKYSKKSQSEWLDKLKKDYGDAYEEELYCIPSRSGDKYFTRALLDTVKDKDVKVFRFYEQSDFLFKSEIERSRKIFTWFDELKNIFSSVKNEVVIGEDFARSGDLTVLWFDEVLPSSKTLTTQTLCVVELKNIPFTNQEAFIKLCIMELKNKFLGAAFDARGNGQMIAENLLIDYPAIILNVMLSRKWYAENFPRLKNAIEDGNTNIPADDLIFQDFLTAELFQGVPLIRERTGRGENKRHGDSLIAKLMSVYALHELTDKRYQPMTYESVKIGNRYRIKGEADKWT